MFLSKWMAKQTVVHPHQEIGLCNNKEETIDSCNNLDESQGHYAETENS